MYHLHESAIVNYFIYFRNGYKVSSSTKTFRIKTFQKVVGGGEQ